GQAAAVCFTVPGAVMANGTFETRFDENVATLHDPAGLPVEVVEGAGPRLHSVTLREADPASTCRFLTGTLGFSCIGVDGDRTRYGLAGSFVDVVPSQGADRAKLSAGMIHHLALRVSDEAAQLEWRNRLKDTGIKVTRVIDRQYFKS